MENRRTRADMPDILREMWETRPARPREGAEVAGVAVAIARRYRLDPVLVRIGFVVTAVYGVGAALYVAGWLLLPPEPGRADEPRRRPRPLAAVGLGVAVLVGVGALIDPNGGWLLPALVVLGLLVLLHRHRGTPQAGGGAETAGVPEAAFPTVPVTGPAAGPNLTKPLPGHAEPDLGADATRAGAADPGSGPDLVKPPVAGAAGPQVAAAGVDGPAPRPPTWDPLGAAPFAWDLPEPAPVAEPPARRRPPVTALTLAAALLAGGVTALAMLIGGALDAPVLLGVVLAVLGAGLVAGAFLRAGRGLIPVAVLVSALAWVVLAAPAGPWRGFGEITVRPAAAAAVEPLYEHGAGSLVLDLRDVDLVAPPGAAAPPVRSRVQLGAGSVEVLLPADADLTLRAGAGLGGVGFAGRDAGGPDASLEVVDDLGDDGVRSGRALELDVEVGLGSVAVRRG
ncbi:MAG TPA: PspC domain-containing protein [Pseudonocardia sp.]|nr:PspC domain-containing protein [Pseudonocardia sp.]